MPGSDRFRRPSRCRPIAQGRHAGRWPLDNKFRAGARRNADVIDRVDFGSRAAIEINRDAVNGDDAERLRRAPKQHGEIKIGDRRCIKDAPQFARARLHSQRGGRIVRVGHRYKVDRQVLRRLAETGAGIDCVAVIIDQILGHHRLRFCRRRIGIEQFLIADNQNALGQAADGSIGAFDAFNNQRARSPAQHLHFAEAVNVRVIPIKSGRLVRWNLHAVFERRVVRLDRSLDDVVLMTDRRHRHAVKVQIGRNRRHGAASASIGLLFPHTDRPGDRRRRIVRVIRTRCRRRDVNQLISQPQNELVARFDTQSRRGCTVRRHVAVAGRAIGLFGIEQREIDAEDAVIASEILRLGSGAACFRPPAGIARRVRLAC